MTKKPTTKSLKEALTKIATMDIGVTKEELLEMTGLDALDHVVGIADAALNPKAGPSAMELKTQEVANFIMKDFKLAFAQNDEIGDALNAAGILSPAGKPWTRSNVSKIMTGVKDLIVANVGGEAPAQDAAESTQECVEPAPVSAVEEVAEAAPAPAELAVATTLTPEPEASPEDDLLAELEALDDLENLTAA